MSETLDPDRTEADEEETSEGAQPIPTSPLLHGVPGAADYQPDQPAVPSAPPLSGPQEPNEPWLAFAQKSPAVPVDRSEPAEPWLAFQQKAQSDQSPPMPGRVEELHRQNISIKNIGNAFLQGLGDGWTGGAIIPAGQPWGMPKGMSDGLDKLLAYPKVKEQEETALQKFNEGFLFPAVRKLAEVATVNAQAGLRVAQVPLQVGSALLSGATSAIVQTGEETGQQALARDIAADIERRAIGGGEAIVPHVGEPVVRPTPEAAIAEFRTEPFAPREPIPVSSLNVRGQLPRQRFEVDATAINAALPPPTEGMARLWRGNRPGEVGTARQFTNDLAGIALPFREGYGGDISYVDVPTANLDDYLQKSGAAPGAEFLVPPEVGARATAVPVRPTQNRPVVITPDIITEAKRLGVLGTQGEWDGTSVRAEVPEPPEPVFPTAEPAAPDEAIHQTARSIDPETFERYDQLTQQRDALRDFIDTQSNPPPATFDDIELRQIAAETALRNANPNGPAAAGFRQTLVELADERQEMERRRDAWAAGQHADTPDIALAREHLTGTLNEINDLSPQVRDAYRQAADIVPNAQVEPAAEPAVPAPPAPTSEAAAAFDIAGHVADRLTAAGRPAEEAQALGALANAYYTTWGQRLRVDPAELYRTEAPQIVGRGSRGTAAGMLERTGNQSVLTLFQRADPTTAIHEFGHQWFGDLIRFGDRADAPANVRVDAALVRRWLGVEDGQELTRRHQEKVARAFENYVMEGRAPSTGLARVFQQFKDWMSKVYETVKQQNVPLNDDVRGVFDRWFASEPLPRDTVVATDGVAPRPPRQVWEIMRDEHVRRNVAEVMQHQELLAYSEWQAANRNAGTLATPRATPATAAVLAEPGARPRNPRSIAQIIAEDKVGPSQAAKTQNEEMIALADWQTANRNAPKPIAEPTPQPSMAPEDVRRIAQEMLTPKEEPAAAPVEPVTATPPAPVEPPKPAEPVVPKNFGPLAKDMSPVYVKVPREPKRLAQFLKEGVTVNRGTANEQTVMRGLMPEPNGRQQLSAVLNGKQGIINVRDGEPLDHARERAVEAGYFPQGGEEINDLYTALDEDTSGRTPRYSMNDDAQVAAYEQATRHNREIDRLAAEHDIDPRGMRLGVFLKAIEDKIGREQFDAQAIMERARAIDAANEMRDDLTNWHDNEAEHAGRIDESEFERLWGEANASQELVDRGAGDGEPGVSAGPAGEGTPGAGSERGGAGVPGPATGEGAGPAEPAPAAGGGAAEPGTAAGAEPKPEPLPVTQPGPGLAEQIKRRKADIPKIGNIRIEYILDGKWDQLVSEVMSELSLSGDPRVQAGTVKAYAEHAIFNETADRFYQAKEAWQANPSEANWAAYEAAKANHAAATAAWSVQLTDWGRTGNAYQAIIRANKRVEATAAVMGETAPPDPQTLFQRQQQIRLLDALNTPEQVGNALVRDMLSPWDKFKNGLMAFYLSNILSGPITHAGYLIGGTINNVLQPLFVIPTQAAIGAARTAAGIGSMDRVLFGEAPASAFGLMNGAMQGVAPALRALQTGTAELGGGVLQKARGGKSPRDAVHGPVTIPYEQQILPTLLGGWPGYVLETPLRAIRAIHVLNYSMRFTSELSRMAYRDASSRLAGLEPTPTEFGAATQRYLNNVPEADMAYAHDEAMRSALMKPPPAGSTQAMVSTILNKHPLLRLIAPFPQIGMNLAEEGVVRTTPLGLLNSNVRGDIAAGGARMDIATGRMLAGSGIAAGIVGLALNGLVTGPGPDTTTTEGRNQRRLMESKGWAPFALKWGDAYIPLRKALGPLGELVGVTTSLAQAGQTWHDEGFPKAAAEVSQGFGQAVLDDTWLRGIHDFFDAATNADQKLGYYLTNMAEGFVPFSQFLSQTARQVDPYVRQAQGFIERVESRTPFASRSLEPQIGPFGDPIAGHSAVGIHVGAPDPVADRMLQLGMGASPFPKEIKGVQMTEAQRAQFGTYAGHLEHQLLMPLVTAPGFAQMPAGMQIKQIEKRITISREMTSKVIQAANPEIITQGVALKQRILMEGRKAAQ